MPREKIRIQLFKARAHFAGRVERGETVVLDERPAFAMVVVQIACGRRFKQSVEMIKAMAVMPADGGVEGDGHLARVTFVGNFCEENFALPQGFYDRFDQFTFCVHELLGVKNLATKGIWRRCNANVTTLQTATVMARAKSKPPSFCTTMPSTVKCDMIAPPMTPSASTA